MPVLNVHVRVNDSATGRPTPCRLRIAGPDGRYLPPLGRPADFPIGRGEDVGGHVYLHQKRYAYIDGSAEIPLPTGTPLSVEISKGPGYVPIVTTVTLGEGQMALRYALTAWAGHDRDDLIVGDARCHAIPPHAADLEAAAEGVDVVQLLASVQDHLSEDGHRYSIIPNMVAFSGEETAFVRQARGGVVVNTFNVHPTLGRLALLNCHRAVYPLTFGHTDENDDWSLIDWCNQCHRKKGLVVWCDAYRPDSGMNGGEGIVAALLGKIDAIEMDGRERPTPFLPNYYRLLQAGVRVPLVGSSAKSSNRQAIGGMRTITPGGDGPRHSTWIEHVREGRTFVSNGPYLHWSIDGEAWPTKITTDGSKPVQCLVEVSSIVPFERLELLANGQVIADARPHGDSIYSATIQHDHPVSDGQWIAARCWGNARTPVTELLCPGGPVFAHTSPTWVEVADRPMPRLESARKALRAEIERLLEWIDSEGRFANPRRRDQMREHAQEALRLA